MQSAILAGSALGGKASLNSPAGRVGRRGRRCMVRCGFGFDVPMELTGPNLSRELQKNYLHVPDAVVGHALNLARQQGKNPHELSAAFHYGRQDTVMGMAYRDSTIGGTREPPRMRDVSGGQAGPGQAPPDLPSLLLDSRIVYVGMPLVPSVTELLIAELLFLQYQNREKPVYMYFNCTGTQNDDQESLGFETEAYAVVDTMEYINPKIHTINVSKAFGQAAMLLAAGDKGCRYALPNSVIRLNQPKMNPTQGHSSDIIIKTNELAANTKTYIDLMAQYTGHPREKIKADISRVNYFDAERAMKYGLIDKVVGVGSKMIGEAKNYDAAMAMSGM